MSLLNLFTQEIIVSRLEVVSGNRSAFSTVTLEAVSIQRLGRSDEEKRLGIASAPGKLYRMYAESNADLLIGDKLVDCSGNEYKVQAVTTPAPLGNFVHKECIIIRVQN